MDSTTLSRRRWLTGLLGGLVLAPGAARIQGQDALPHLDEKDKMAVAFAYVADAKRVDKARFPTYKAGQTCANCSQIGGKDGAAWRPCKIFPGKHVAAAGWCKVWVKKA